MADIPYQTLFEKMNIPRFIVVPGEDQKTFIVADINDLGLKYFDLPREQVVNQNIKTFMDHENAIHFFQSLKVCMSKKKPVTIQTLPGVPGRIKVYGFYISPCYDEHENIQYLDVVGQLDVADQSILQRERDDAVSLMTSIFDVSEVGVIVTDENARVVRVNDSFIRTYGWSREELLNSEFTGLVTPDEREVAHRNHEEFIRTGRRSSGELKIIRKDGTVANALFTTATLELSQKRRFQVTTVMDITLRKQMEQSLREAKDQADSANRAKSTFLANMSHELRTPLNAIIGFSEMMINETFGKLGHEKYIEYMDDVLNSAKHLLEIINEVLDMSKIEAGRIELDESEVNIKNLLESVARMMESRAFGNDVEIHVDISPDLPDLLGDQRLLRQVMINLVTNAVKFSNHGGDVHLFADLDPQNRLRIMIEDHGVGIPKEKIRQALEPFGQITDRAENSSKQQGTGLGLPLAKAMIDLHGGELDLESEEGKGTKVIITFPSSRIIEKSAAHSLLAEKQ